MTWFIFILGASLAGFVQGLTGFAFALIAMSFWAWVLTPQISAPLVVFASLWCHFISLSREKKHVLSRHLVLPYLLAGLIGVPLGSFLLDYVNAAVFKLILGLFLIIWCPIMYFAPKIKLMQKPNPAADAIVGFLGGVLGGLGGFCGALPSAWVMLKGLTKDQQRYILRHFNFAIQIFTLAVYLWRGTLNFTHLNYIVVILFAVSLPAILGAHFFYRISELQFKRIVLSLLFMSGWVLISTTFLHV